jgi:dienelactone hydrolase
MTRLEFVRHRVAFTGLPFGIVQSAAAHADAGRWYAGFLACARQMRVVAVAAEQEGRPVTAMEAWRWAAAAYHVSTFGLQFDPETIRRSHVGHCRRLAALAYQRALRLDTAVASPVVIPCAGGNLHGYLRLPLGSIGGVVVMVNGLDSLCEVELHAFGDSFLARSQAVLALDLPADLDGRPRAPRFRAELLATEIVTWIGRHDALVDVPLGAFGVSFGGHIAARLLAGDRRFVGAVAVSAPAYLSFEVLPPRLRTMFALAFALDHEQAAAALAADITIDEAPRPNGRLLLLHMQRDELFGDTHLAALQRWGGPQVSRWTFDAEHVGTSQMHRWLPAATDWLAAVLAGKEIAAC